MTTMRPHSLIRWNGALRQLLSRVKIDYPVKLAQLSSGSYICIFLHICIWRLQSNIQHLWTNKLCRKRGMISKSPQYGGLLCWSVESSRSYFDIFCLRHFEHRFLGGIWEMLTSNDSDPTRRELLCVGEAPSMFWYNQAVKKQEGNGPIDLRRQGRWSF